jgi:protein-disulfide isomerase
MVDRPSPRGRASLRLVRAWFSAAILACLACGSAPETPPSVTIAAQDGPQAAAAARGAGGEPAPGTRVPVTSTDPSWGSPLAPVTLVEWGDFQCPFTRKLVATIHELQKIYGEKRLRVVWKHNPLSFHKDARPAAIAAATVFQLGGSRAFWRFHGLAFENQKDLTPENFHAWAKQAGVDSHAFADAFERKAHERKVEQDIDLGKAAGVTGTPASIINGVFLSGAQPVEKFREVIDEQLRVAKELASAGVPPERIYAEASDRNVAKNPPPKKKAPKETEDPKIVWRVPVDGSPARGKPTALVTIVMFSGFQCPFCGKVKPTLDGLLAAYGDKVRLVVKQHPLSFHAHGDASAQLALEARAQKGDAGFWSAFDLLFANQQNLGPQDLEGYAKTLGLNATRTKLAIAERRHAAVIERDQALAEGLEASGTPHFFINGKRLVGNNPPEKFKAIIDEEIAHAEGFVKAGTAPAKVYEALQKGAREPPPYARVVVPAPTRRNPSKGPANARIVVQMFAGFQCPFSKRVQDTIDELLAAFPGQVRVVWRHLPLPMHQDGGLAAEAAVEAFAQKGDAGFWRMAKVLFEDQGAAGLGRAQLERRAAELGLDVPRFKAALDAHTHKATVDADVAIANKAQITSTPAFAIQDYYVSGAAPLARFKQRVQRALGPREPIQPGSLHPVTPPAPPAPAAPPSPAAPGAQPMFGAKHLLVMYAGSRRAPPGVTRTRDQARTRAAEALAKARKGARFEDLVGLYSDEPGAGNRGGDLGRFPQGAMVPEFQTALEKTPVGSLSGVFETPFGFHVLLRTE